VSGAGRTQSLQLSSPERAFSPGALVEGRHTVYFEGGGRLSRQTTIEIRFDNAAPTVSLSTPAEPGVPPGGQLVVAGSVLPGWSVSVDGQPVSQDAEQRFSSATQMPASGRPLVVALGHPVHGTQLYLRRPAGGR
jgi:hypothetical protein